MNNRLLRVSTAAITSAVISFSAIAAGPAPIPALMTPKAKQAPLLGLAKAGSEYVAVGGNGVILRSADGQAWSQVPSPVDTALTQVSFAEGSKRGWAVGHDGAILQTSDEGKTWTLQSWKPLDYVPLFSVCALDADHAVAVGAFGALKSTSDGGKTWVDVDAPEITGDKFHFNAITRLHDGRLLITGERGLVGLSSDGVKWTKISTGYEGSFFGALPIGETGVVVFGMRGNVYASTNPESGKWDKVETSTTASLFGGSALAANSVLLVGADGTLLQVDVGSTTAKPLKLSADSHDQVLTAAVAYSSGSLVLAGDKGVSKASVRLEQAGAAAKPGS